MPSSKCYSEPVARVMRICRRRRAIFRNDLIETSYNIHTQAKTPNKTTQLHLLALFYEIDCVSDALVAKHYNFRLREMRRAILCC